MGLPFETCAVDADETPPAGMSPEGAVRVIAERKAEAARRTESSDRFDWILAADTVILDRAELIGKPADADEAAGLLRRFSGGTHRVLTGVALFVRSVGVLVSECTGTDVRFAPLSEEEVRWYVATGEWIGAAGGYRIQERGSCLVEEIRGSYSNVMGLPIRTIYGMVRTYGYPVGRAGS